MKIFF